MSTLLPVAHYIVKAQASIGASVTPMKLQKLLYYVKAWGLVAGTPLFNGTFKKWKYGPVNQYVYSAFKACKGNPIPATFGDIRQEPTGEKKKLIDFITQCYGEYDALALSAMTHKEDPWLKTPQDETIQDEVMLQYYSKHHFAKNFPFDPLNNPFYPLQSDLGSSFTMDMSEKDAEKITVYPSYQSYLHHLKRASGDFDQWFNKLMK